MKCAIITPVGPGHEPWYEICRKSIEAAWNYDHGPFDGLDVIPMWDLEGAHGRSARRNDGISQARREGCEWIFFLDADDQLHAEAFARFAAHVDTHDAVWGTICEATLDPPKVRMRPGQLRGTDDIRDILRTDPFLSLQMGHFVRAECAAAVGFDTAMNVGEDFKYYLKIWKRFRCAKVEDVFFINVRGAHSVGPRSGDGRAWRSAATKQLQQAIGCDLLDADVTLDGVTAHFSVSNPFDLIQAHHCRGTFFEQSELMALRDHIGPGKRIVEVGANVGNHVVFYAQHMAAERIFPFEPNPESVRLLCANIANNGLDAVVDGRGIGVGLGRETGSFHAVDIENNLGATRLQAGGDLPVEPLDAMLAGERVDFIKIDAEGMEFDVLEGARQTIAAHRPPMYIEIWNDRRTAFETWCAENRYAVIGRAAARNAVNFLIAPIKNPGR